MSEEHWLTIAEAATMLSVGEPTIRQLIERGALRAERRDGELKLSRAALLGFMRADEQTLERGAQPGDIAAIPPDDLRPGE